MITNKNAIKDLNDVLKHWRDLLIRNEFPIPAIISIINSDISQWKSRHNWIIRKDKKELKNK